MAYIPADTYLRSVYQGGGLTYLGITKDGPVYIWEYSGYLNEAKQDKMQAVLDSAARGRAEYLAQAERPILKHDKADLGYGCPECEDLRDPARESLNTSIGACARRTAAKIYGWDLKAQEERTRALRARLQHVNDWAAQCRADLERQVHQEAEARRAAGGCGVTTGVDVSCGQRYSISTGLGRW